MSRPLIEYAQNALPLTDVPVFDMHAHIDRMAHLDAPALATQVELMDRLGIRLAAISSVLAIDGEFARGNDNVAAACAQFPGRFIGYCHISGNYPETLADELARCLENPCFKAIKLYQVGCAFTESVFAPVWKIAASRKMPVMAHTWGGDFTGLDKVAEKHPKVPFLAAHAGSGFAYKKYLEPAKKLANFYLDLTYSREHSNQIEHFVEEAGADKIVWGTDFPCFSMAHQLSKVLYARIPDDAKRAILYDNAARIFRLAATK